MTLDHAALRRLCEDPELHPKPWEVADHGYAVDLAEPHDWHRLIYDEGGHTKADAAFIAAARTALPALLDEVERLRSALQDHAECEWCDLPVMLLWRERGQSGWTATCATHCPARFPHDEEVVYLAAPTDTPEEKDDR